MSSKQETYSADVSRVAAAAVLLGSLALGQSHEQVLKPVKTEALATASQKGAVAIKGFVTGLKYASSSNYLLQPAEAPPPSSSSTTTTTTPVSVETSFDESSVLLRRIAGCESAGLPYASINYQAQNPTSSASGGFQFLDSTWDGFAGYSRALYAPPAVQIDKAFELYQQQGTSPWVSSESCWSG